MYRAIVKNNVDPMRLGRVQIFIPSLHNPDAPADRLPWAYYCCPFACGSDFGSYIAYPIGSVVYVTLEEGTTGTFVLMGGIYSIRSERKTYEVKGVDVSRVGDKLVEIPTGSDNLLQPNILYKTLKGAEIAIDDTKGREAVTIKDYTGMSLRLVGRASDGGRKPKDIQKQYLELSGKGFKVTIGNTKGTINVDEMLTVEVGGKKYKAMLEEELPNG